MDNKCRLIDSNRKISLFNRIIKKYIKERYKKFLISKRSANKIQELIKSFNLQNKNHIILKSQIKNNYKWKKFISHNFIPLIAKDLLIEKELCYKNKYKKKFINDIMANFINSKIMDIKTLNKNLSIN
ncbi:hypothetical protein bcCo53_000235 [Borrelia coriaceae]|uniref:Uncharacterized protein n=1 Tax=Borrelia coriaceae ATCC 43381 TaxID=1408429 RepID=W5SU18_9SPIR|nr:hypothetical protein [Borrelia coriaceae]AHH10400.1 hypothetical protein BCO_0900003 [Borrelia coriaceae ATCC 43381]UPA16108.1 hypothetical protein bcCo53_000235 [Borrelia coriaceae]